MKNQRVSVLISSLKPHEEVDMIKVDELVYEFELGAKLMNPIVVARDVMVILDGHHRVAAYAKRGKKKISAIFVDYFADTVEVSLRRPKLMTQILKEIVVMRALLGKRFPRKTTRHKISISH